MLPSRGRRARLSSRRRASTQRLPLEGGEALVPADRGARRSVRRVRTAISGRSSSTGGTTQLGNCFYRGVARFADGVTPAPGPVTNAAHRSISPRRWSNRSLRA